VSAKSRLSVYLEPARLRQLEAFAKAHGQSKSLVAEAAIAAFLEPPLQERHEAALMRRLDQQSRTADRLARDLTILIELTALFVRQWLVVAPVIGEAGQAAAQARGRERYQGFISALGRRLAKGRRVTGEIAPDLDDGRPPSAADGGRYSA
jgi:predicted transcriptional regulator